MKRERHMEPGQEWGEAGQEFMDERKNRRQAGSEDSLLEFAALI